MLQNYLFNHLLPKNNMIDRYKGKVCCDKHHLIILIQKNNIFSAYLIIFVFKRDQEILLISEVFSIYYNDLLQSSLPKEDKFIFSKIKKQ